MDQTRKSEIAHRINNKKEVSLMDFVTIIYIMGLSHIVLKYPDQNFSGCFNGMFSLC